MTEDRHGNRINSGDRIVFLADRGTKMRGQVCDAPVSGKGKVSVQLDKDPFPVEVDASRVQKENTSYMPTSTTNKPLKTLRREAREAGVSGWDTLTKDELETALAGQSGDEDQDEEESEEAEAPEEETVPTATRTRTRSRTDSKHTSTRPAAKKASTPKASTRSTSKVKDKATTAKRSERTTSRSSTGVNPFREGSNLFHITQSLIRGGKRSDLVDELKGKLSFNPRVQSPRDFDKEAEIDRRLKVVGYILRDDHGFEYVHEGRGTDAYIKAVPPKSKS